MMTLGNEFDLPGLSSNPLGVCALGSVTNGVNRATSTHAARRRAIRERPELAAVSDPFNELYNLAWTARYLCLACPLEDVLRAHDILIKVQGILRASSNLPHRTEVSR